MSRQGIEPVYTVILNSDNPGAVSPFMLSSLEYTKEKSVEFAALPIGSFFVALDNKIAKKISSELIRLVDSSARFNLMELGMSQASLVRMCVFRNVKITDNCVGTGGRNFMFKKKEDALNMAEALNIGHELRQRKIEEQEKATELVSTAAEKTDVDPEPVQPLSKNQHDTRKYKIRTYKELNLKDNFAFLDHLQTMSEEEVARYTKVDVNRCKCRNIHFYNFVSPDRLVVMFASNGYLEQSEPKLVPLNKMHSGAYWKGANGADYMKLSSEIVLEHNGGQVNFFNADKFDNRNCPQKSLFQSVKPLAALPAGDWFFMPGLNELFMKAGYGDFHKRYHYRSQKLNIEPNVQVFPIPFLNKKEEEKPLLAEVEAGTQFVTKEDPSEVIVAKSALAKQTPIKDMACGICWTGVDGNTYMKVTNSLVLKSIVSFYPVNHFLDQDIDRSKEIYLVPEVRLANLPAGSWFFETISELVLYLDIDGKIYTIHKTPINSLSPHLLVRKIPSVESKEFYCGSVNPLHMHIGSYWKSPDGGYHMKVDDEWVLNSNPDKLDGLAHLRSVKSFEVADEKTCRESMLQQHHEAIENLPEGTVFYDSRHRETFVKSRDGYDSLYPKFNNPKHHAHVPKGTRVQPVPFLEDLASEKNEVNISTAKEISPKVQQSKEQVDDTDFSVEYRTLQDGMFFRTFNEGNGNCLVGYKIDKDWYIKIAMHRSDNITPPKFLDLHWVSRWINGAWHVTPISGRKEIAKYTNNLPFLCYMDRERLSSELKLGSKKEGTSCYKDANKGQYFIFQNEHHNLFVFKKISCSVANVYKVTSEGKPTGEALFTWAVPDNAVIRHITV